MVLEKAKPISETDEYIKLLLYGQPGVGKTSFCADAPNPIYFDFERSTEVLRHTGHGDIPVLKPANMPEFLTGIKELPKSSYQTVIIDTLSQLQDFQLAEHMLGVEKASNGSKSRLLPLFQDFRISTQTFKEIARILQDMPINVVIIAHEKHMTQKLADGTEKYIGVRPQMTPELNDSVARLINVCAYYTKETNIKGETKRKLYVNGTSKILAKNRLGISELFIEDPTWQTLTQRNKVNAS